MIKRLWSAFALACALLLAANSLLAKESFDEVGLGTTKAADPSIHPRAPRPAPIDGAASPGDDDMPGRGSGPGSPTVTSMTRSDNPAPITGSTLRDLTMGMRWYLMRSMHIMR